MPPTTLRDIFNNTISPFTLYNGCDKKADSKGTVLSKMDVSAQYDNQVFNDSDLHIVKFIAEHVVMNLGMLETAINYYHSKNSQNSSKSNLIIIRDVEYLKNRLSVIKKSQLIYRYVFNQQHINESGNIRYNPSSYYIVSPHGYNFIKRILYYEDVYDEYLSITPLEDVFKYLTTVSACQDFIKFKGFDGYRINYFFYDAVHRKRCFLYGLVEVQTSRLNKVKIIVEPIKFNFNEGRVTKEEWLDIINDRLDTLYQYMASITDTDVYVVFACESFEGIKKAVPMARDKLARYSDRLYFTIEAIIRRYGFVDSFTCIKDNMAVFSSLTLD